MKQIPVIFWTGTGNTQMMADAVAEAINAAGAEAVVKNISEITADEAAGYDALALGCPAMGAEVLEECEFEPFFTELEGKLAGMVKNKATPVILVCASGARSKRAVAIAKKLGFENARSLGGGLGAWRSASLPVEKA